MESYFEIYKNMFPNSIKLSYKGTVTFQLIDSLLQIISSRLDVIEDNINIRRKVYCVLMECLQNLSIHIEEIGQPAVSEFDFSCALLTIENDTDGYIISTGNFVKNDKQEYLRERLEEINNCNLEELKALYNKILTNNTYNAKGGGGLGFVDIARKTNGKIKYDFIKVDSCYSFFHLIVKIKKTN